MKSRTLSCLEKKKFVRGRKPRKTNNQLEPMPHCKEHLTKNEIVNIKNETKEKYRVVNWHKNSTKTICCIFALGIMRNTVAITLSPVSRFRSDGEGKLLGMSHRFQHC